MADVVPDVRVFQDLEVLSHAAATVFVETAGQAVKGRGRFMVAFSGGRTPRRLYSLLAESPYREMLQWTQLHAFWVDERCVPVEDLNSNYRQTRELLLSHVPVPPENIHRVRTELDPELAAEDYELVLRRIADPPLMWPRFDLALLGLGQDGHTASLFPGSPVEVPGPVVAVHTPAQEAHGWRVSLTPLVLNAARQILFLVEGIRKSKMVASVLYGERQPEQLPAQRIEPEDGELIWMLDAGAAARH